MLVDPELAERARASLGVAERSPPTAAPSAVRVPEPRRRRRFPWLAVAAVAALGVATGLATRWVDREPDPYFAPGATPAAGAPTAAAEVAEPATTKPAAKRVAKPAAKRVAKPAAKRVAKPAAKRVAKPAAKRVAKAAAPPKTTAGGRGGFEPARTFAWAPAPQASYYRIVFRRGGTVVYQAFPKRARIVLPPSFEFVRGTYEWIVTPGFGTRIEQRFGREIVRSRFEISPG